MQLSQELQSSINTRIKLHHDLYSLQIKDVFWEEILYKSLLENSLNPVWDQYSHKIEEDISSDIYGRISCKTGQIKKTKKSEALIISGSRTTRFKTLPEKIDYLSEKRIEWIFLLTRPLCYQVLVVDPAIFCYKDMEWKQTSGGYRAISEDGKIKIDIVKAMSDQVWYSIALDKISSTHEMEI